MIRIRVPATSANLGPGFDCLGIALGLYNTFEVEESEELVLKGADERFRGEDNLFVKGFRAAGGTENIRVTFSCDIPVSRDLGSSASMYTGGVLACQLLHHCLDPKKAFTTVSDLEGHPDNAAPSVYGGLTASMVGSQGWITHAIPVNETLRFTVMIPDVEIRTEDAKKLLPDSYPGRVAAVNGAKAILTAEALRTGNMDLLWEAATDQLHEPYRRTLIPNYDTVKSVAESDNGGVVVISGSGSTCLLISDRPLSDPAAVKIMTLPEHWNVQELPVSSGPEYQENDDLWQAII